MDFCARGGDNPFVQGAPSQTFAPGMGLGRSTADASEGKKEEKDKGKVEKFGGGDRVERKNAGTKWPEGRSGTTPRTIECPPQGPGSHLHSEP